METTNESLLEKLKSLLKKDAVAINHYFAFEFWDEYPDEDQAVLDYLSDRFFDIDMMWVEDRDITEMTYETLHTAIRMLESKAQVKTVYCPVKDGEVDGGDCIIICDVADRLILPTVLPEGIVWDEQQREKCKACPYHDDA